MDDDPDLRRFLGGAGLPADLPALDALLAGIDAAPSGHDPDAWLELIGTGLPDGLAAACVSGGLCDAGRAPASQTTPTACADCATSCANAVSTASS